MSVDPGISTATPASRASRTPSKADSKFNYLGVQYSHNDPATAANLMGSALQKDPDIVGVFATNLFAAEGTATGVRQAGKGDQVKIVSFDAGPNQVKDLKDGTVQALVAQQPGIDRPVRRRHGRRRARRRHRHARRSRPASPIITKDNIDGDGGQAPSTSPAAELAENGRAVPPVARLGDARPATGGRPAV